MRRKLVKQGKNALTLTLPSAWTKSNNLKAGDEINLLEHENALTVSSEKGLAAEEITFDLSGLVPRLADRFITKAYQKGYDKITIKFDNPELMLAVKQKMPELMGYEILNIDKDSMEIQVISQNLELDPEVLLRRAFLILMDMAKTCQEAWHANDKEALKNVYDQDIDVNKFTYFCLRKLNKSQQVMSFGRATTYYLIESIESLGDELKNLAMLLSEVKPDNDVLRILSKMNKLFRISYEFWYKPRRELAVDAYNVCGQIRTNTEDEFATKSSKINRILFSINIATTIIYHLTTRRLDTLEEAKQSKVF
ncbi:MAG: hypothetical protein ABIG95_04680 [Candidatus Woesearchaeota archaeon]